MDIFPMSTSSRSLRITAKYKVSDVFPSRKTPSSTLHCDLLAKLSSFSKLEFLSSPVNFHVHFTIHISIMNTLTFLFAILAASAISARELVRRQNLSGVPSCGQTCLLKAASTPSLLGKCTVVSHVLNPHASLRFAIYRRQS